VADVLIAYVFDEGAWLGSVRLLGIQLFALILMEKNLYD